MAKRHEQHEESIPDEPSPARNRQLQEEYALLRYEIEQSESELNEARARVARERDANEARALELDDREQHLIGLKREAEEARSAASVAKKTLAAREKELRELEAHVLGEQKQLREEAGAHADEMAAVRRDREVIEQEKKQLALDRAQLDTRAAELTGVEADHHTRRGGKR